MKNLSYSEKIALANNDQTSPEVLDRLANEEDEEILYEVAANANTLADTLNRLYSISQLLDDDEIILECLAGNPSCQVQLIKDLYWINGYPGVLRALAGNQSTPEEIQNNLAINADYYVRRALENNPTVSNESLGLILRTDKDVIQKAILTGLDILNYHEKKNMAQDVNSSTSLLNRLSQENDRDIKIQVALNRKTSIDTMDLLFTDKDPTVRIAAFLAYELKKINY